MQRKIAKLQACNGQILVKAMGNGRNPKRLWFENMSEAVAWCRRFGYKPRSAVTVENLTPVHGFNWDAANRRARVPRAVTVFKPKTPPPAARWSE